MNVLESMVSPLYVHGDLSFASSPVADKFYHLAKEQGFRSRSAFKLVQINRQFDFLSGCHALLDLCAAPGGWLQVAQQHLPVGSTIVGVDTAPIRPIRGVITLTEDITSDGCKNAIKRATNGVDTFDVVLHDGAPNVGGAWAKDAYEQSTLTLDALRLATQVLAPRGEFRLFFHCRKPLSHVFFLWFPSCFTLPTNRNIRDESVPIIGVHVAPIRLQQAIRQCQAAQAEIIEARIR